MIGEEPGRMMTHYAPMVPATLSGSAALIGPADSTTIAKVDSEVDDPPVEGVGSDSLAAPPARN